MAKVIKETRTVENVDEPDEAPPASTMISKVVYIITGVIIALLSFRFLLSLLGANRENAFADFIYAISYPFVAPFFGLFNYDPQYGVARFELETLFAILVYAFVAWLIMRLVQVGAKE